MNIQMQKVREFIGKRSETKGKKKRMKKNQKVGIINHYDNIIQTYWTIIQNCSQNFLEFIRSLIKDKIS